ncbi:hypothetical protein BKA65DRAFT_435334 [Rhexocercosporidium sp. MPI-PUGE-AT-0058]|nr:hypothetical protein BKA65DRAFT_435334 [Rhexocercosporidium sp. MPI-PUGE-AT-0058]
MSNPPAPPPVVALAPWTLKGTIYSFMFYISPSSAQNLQSSKSLLYSPLEAASPFSDGRLVGGLASVQIIRYTESPVGPYDELIIVPGNIEYELDTKDKDGSLKRETKKNLRVTRIYVSQEATCWNGRNNWNIPKHLADFEFKPLPNKAVRISVYPLETAGSGTQRVRSKSPFFSAIYKPITYAPSFPLSTAAAKYVGLDLSLVQPPLPDGTDSSVAELVGTKQWRCVMPHEWSSKASLGWWDLKRGQASEEDALLGGGGDVQGDETSHNNWWPGFSRWRIGILMENATIKFPEGEHWNGPEE